MTTQGNFTISCNVTPDMTVSATFSCFVEDASDADAQGDMAAQIFNAWIAGYRRSLDELFPS